MYLCFLLKKYIFLHRSILRNIIYTGEVGPNCSLKYFLYLLQNFRKPRGVSKISSDQHFMARSGNDSKPIYFAPEFIYFQWRTEGMGKAGITLP